MRWSSRPEYSIHELNWIDKKENWQGMKSIIKITSERMIGEGRTVQDRYYISSLGADAAYLANIGGLRTSYTGNWT